MEQQLKRPKMEKDLIITVLITVAVITLGVACISWNNESLPGQAILLAIPSICLLAAILRADKLKAACKAREAQWEAEMDGRLSSKAEALGITDNPKLVGYILGLEERIVRLEEERQER